MDKRERENMDWSEMVGESLRDVECSPSDELWSRIETSTLAESKGRLIAPWWIAAAVAAAIVGFVVIFTPASVEEEIQYWDDFVEVINDDNHTIESVQIAEEAVSLVAVRKEPIVILDEVVLDQTNNKNAEDRIIDTNVAEIPEEQPIEENVEDEVAQTKTTEERVSTKLNREPIEYILTPKHKSQTTIAMNVGGGASQSNSSGFGSAPYDLLSVDCYREISIEESYDDIAHRQPFSAELTIGRSLPIGLNIVSGVSYSMLASDVDLRSEPNSLVQRLHFVGIPLRLELPIWSSDRLMLYVGVGGQVEYCLLAKIGSVVYDEQRWHLSLDGVIGAQYKIAKSLSLYAEPDISYYFTQTRLNTIRNESPLTFTMRFGVRFTL
ncbi:MAG: hypothetical protein SNH55_06170 [Rikenellaceae bacterium]